MTDRDPSHRPPEETVEALSEALESGLHAAPAPRDDETLASALACQSDIVAVRVDPRGHIVDWPARGRRLLGWSTEQVAGRPLGGLFTDEDRAGFESRLAQRATQDGEWTAMLRSADGEALPAGVRLLFYRGGESAIVLLRDRRGSEASERWLRWSRGLLSVLGGATLVLDPGGRIREIGTGWLAGGRDDLPKWLGRHAAELFDSERPEVISALRWAAKRGEWHGELTLAGAPCAIQFRAVRDEQGRLEAIVGARLLGELGDARDLFRTIPVGMILVDGDFRILEANDELAGVIGPGVLPPDPVGLDIRSLEIFQTRAVLTALDSLPAKGKFDLPEARLHAHDGEGPVVHMRGKTLRDPAGGVAGHVVMLLSRAGRTNVERQLLRAQKMESIGNFASGLAHDFGNFVSVILGKVGVLRVKLPADPHITDDLDDIDKAAKRAQHLSQDLMRFARGARGRVTHLDLNALIEEVGSLIRTSVGKRIELVQRLAEGLPRVGADEVELQQLVLNLCLNARDAMPDGGRLTIETRPLGPEDLARFEGDDVPASGVVLTVKDTGQGMTPEVAERIFEPFFTTKEDSNKGTGLGLAMVYSIVRRHGGTVDVRSQPGLGTSFEIALPAAAGGSEPERVAPILVVDDEPAFREMIRLILEEDGHAVRLAANGIEAMRTLRNDYASLAMVILDLRMPGIDGLAVLEELRSLAPDLPVLVTTGWASEEEKTAAIEGGAQRVLQKPYRVAELRAALDELLAGGPGGSAPSSAAGRAAPTGGGHGRPDSGVISPTR